MHFVNYPRNLESDGQELPTVKRAYAEPHRMKRFREFAQIVRQEEIRKLRNIPPIRRSLKSIRV